MNRLVIAVVILLGVLLGLRFMSSSSLFQRNVANQVSPSTTRSTGFSTEARNGASPTATVTNNTQPFPPNSQPASVTPAPNTATQTPQVQPPVRAGW